MIYKSLAQQRRFNTKKPEGVDVEKSNKETNDRPLPERVGKTRLQKAKDQLKRGMIGKKR